MRAGLDSLGPHPMLCSRHLLCVLTGFSYVRPALRTVSKFSYKNTGHTGSGPTLKILWDLNCQDKGAVSKYSDILSFWGCDFNMGILRGGYSSAHDTFRGESW